MEFTTEEERLWALFYPRAHNQSAALKTRNGRFVHYTSASVAMSIITKKEVWMRNARTMNDFMEIEHGKSCLFQAYNGVIGIKLQAFLNGMHKDFTNDLQSRFDSWLPDLQHGTFITCFSEHRDEEDDIGRLSMWRGYARKNGVALVMRNTPFLSPSDALSAYSSPVAYLSQRQFEEQFNIMADGLMLAGNELSAMPYEALMAYVFTAFRFSVLCTKHPGFAEEVEWRVIYMPNFTKSEQITHHSEIVDGVPQIVCKIPLVDVPEKGLVGMEIPELLDRLIIGPSEHANTMFDAFYEAMTDAGIKDAEQKIVMSDIPIRQT